jgi:hypothetical protein
MDHEAFSNWYDGDKRWQGLAGIPFAFGQTQDEMTVTANKEFILQMLNHQLVSLGYELPYLLAVNRLYRKT